MECQDALLITVVTWTRWDSPRWANASVKLLTLYLSVLSYWISSGVENGM